MMKYLMLPLLSLILLSCTSGPPAEKLFPFGVYHHQVALDVKGNKHNFTGVNKWSRDQLTLTALGAFDVTLIKFTDDLVNNKQQVYVDRNFLPLTDEKAKSYLSYLKNFYSLDRSICQGKVCRKNFYGMEFLFDLNNLNQVERIKFTRDDVKVDIEVVGYEKIP
ncbi:MAG: hypothetical protein H0V66_12205 [Bdellovibrionales bacterium]|nr:hypothetical protein [Bdellovibrionales bacterium]